MKYLFLLLFLPLSLLGQDVIVQDMRQDWSLDLADCDHYYGTYPAEQVVEVAEYYPFNFEECTRINMHFKAYRVEIYGHDNLNKVTITVFINVGDMEVALEQHFTKKSKVNMKLSEIFNEIVYNNIGKE